MKSCRPSSPGASSKHALGQQSFGLSSGASKYTAHIPLPSPCSYSRRSSANSVGSSVSRKSSRVRQREHSTAVWAIGASASECRRNPAESPVGIAVLQNQAD
jgi:hypothetical protein